MSFSKSTELTYTFIEFGNSPFVTSKENMRLLELFILYEDVGLGHRNTDINKARCALFSKSPNPELEDEVLSRCFA